MPAKAPQGLVTADDLSALGGQIRVHRKALRLNATTVAEAAGISRVTLHRIEKGEPSVTIGAYLNTMSALGLRFGITPPVEATEVRQEAGRTGWIPARIRLADYPQLAQLAWQVQGTEILTPQEAWDIYERNWRHVDAGALMEHERNLINALRLVFGGDAKHV
jgi:transcriptional regulator with XRE-family HTH domain